VSVHAHPGFGTSVLKDLLIEKLKEEVETGPTMNC